MKTLTTWLPYMILQVAIFSLLYAWKIGGNEHAGNLVQVVLWMLAIVGIIVGFMAARGEHVPRDPVRRLVEIFNDIALMVILAWYGHFALMCFYLLGCIGSAAHRDRYDDAGKPLPPAPLPTQPNS